jgi:hypothetical protein
MSHKHSRRVVLQVLGAAGAATLGMSFLGCGSGASEPDCNDTSGVDTAMRTTLHYTPSGTDAARRCSGCQLYTGAQGACGTCQLFPGPVSPDGSCDSFVARA